MMGGSLALVSGHTLIEYIELNVLNIDVWVLRVTHIITKSDTIKLSVARLRYLPPPPQLCGARLVAVICANVA